MDEGWVICGRETDGRHDYKRRLIEKAPELVEELRRWVADACDMEGCETCVADCSVKALLDYIDGKDAT
jgi:ferredoxin